MADGTLSTLQQPLNPPEEHLFKDSLGCLLRSVPVTTLLGLKIRHGHRYDNVMHTLNSDIYIL